MFTLRHLVMALATVAAIAWSWHMYSAGQARERPKTEAAVDSAESHRLSAQGAQAMGQALDITVHQARDADVAAAIAAAQAKEAPNADVPLDPARAHRHRALDDELCRLRPSLGRCRPASGGDAGGSH
ncbi:hypothetical protein [Phenylobacterium sp.]|uniref:hypothetical protein n=1 Tax=Phenylobacterium sp. TaxID=1871053 RepID=UPI0030F39A6F